MANLTFTDGEKETITSSMLEEDAADGEAPKPTVAQKKTPLAKVKSEMSDGNPFSFREGPNDELTKKEAAKSATKGEKRKPSNPSQHHGTGEAFAVTDDDLNAKLHAQTESALKKRGSVDSLENLEDAWLEQVGSGMNDSEPVWEQNLETEVTFGF